MKAWANIPCSIQDPEIVQINRLEKKLGKLSVRVMQVRELITRFEVCHFKYQQHLKYIRNSIDALEPCKDPNTIGIKHIHLGESAVNRDTTGRSRAGMQFVCAMRDWLNDSTKMVMPEYDDVKTGEEIKEWLGSKTAEKSELIRLLIARLSWDWKLFKKLQHGGKYEDIKFQASRMDICHYAFPENLSMLIKKIGRMKAVDDSEFEGCGSYNHCIETYLHQEFSDLNEKLKSLITNQNKTKDDLTRIWLLACLAKTIKENIHIPASISIL